MQAGSFLEVQNRGPVKTDDWMHPDTGVPDNSVSLAEQRGAAIAEAERRAQEEGDNQAEGRNQAEGDNQAEGRNQAEGSTEEEGIEGADELMEDIEDDEVEDDEGEEDRGDNE